MECLRFAAATFATALENSTWLTSMGEGGGSLDRDGTSGHGVELEGFHSSRSLSSSSTSRDNRSVNHSF